MTKRVLYFLDDGKELPAAIRLVADLKASGYFVQMCLDPSVADLLSEQAWQIVTGENPVLVENKIYLVKNKPFAIIFKSCSPDYFDLWREVGVPVLGGSALPEGLAAGSATLKDFSSEEVLLYLMQLSQPQHFWGITMLVTAGPTAEDIDPVRFLTNRSSGKMGVAIALGAALRGARVLLAHGPMGAPVPRHPSLEDLAVRSAQQMHDVVREHWQETQVAVLCAAVADFRPARYVPQKIKKVAGEGLSLQLARTPDILAELGAQPHHPFLVGFAAETDDVEINALAKLRKKHCDLLCANDLRKPGSGFAVDTNQVTIYASDGSVRTLPMLSKQETAFCILDEISRRLAKKPVY